MVHKFSKVLLVVNCYSKYTRVLTFENLSQVGGHTHWACGGMSEGGGALMISGSLLVAAIGKPELNQPETKSNPYTIY